MLSLLGRVSARLLSLLGRVSARLLPVLGSLRVSARLLPLLGRVSARLLPLLGRVSPAWRLSLTPKSAVLHGQQPCFSGNGIASPFAPADQRRAIVGTPVRQKNRAP